VRKLVRQSRLTRRVFLKVAVAGSGLGLLQACAPAAPAQPTAAPAQPTIAKPAAQVPAVPVLATPAAPAATPAPTQAPAATKPAGPKTGGTFTMAKTSTWQEFNPGALSPGYYTFIRAIWSTLAHYDSQLKPQPELAEKWDFSADGKTLTFKLREGVKYHSGREFTSADVKASVQFGQSNELAIMRTLFNTIKEVQTPEKYVAAFKFDTVNPSAYDILDTLFMIDKETIEDRSKTAVGTGPFKLDKYIPNDRAEFVANKDYWDKGKPYLDRYITRVIPDNAALSINLETGAVDAIWQPTYQDVVRLRDAGGKFVTDMGAPGATAYDLAINTQIKPFTDKKVRQAIAWSMDRARFCKTTLQSLAEATCLIWPKHSWAYFPDLEGKVGYDLDKAASLLKEAGLGNGFETEILTSAKTAYGYREIAEILQADLKKIKVDAKITDLDPAQYQNRSQVTRDIQIMAHTYGRLNRDPGSTLTGAKSWYTDKEGGWTRLNNPEYESLRQELFSTLDQEKRKATCRKIQELALDECFTNPLAPAQRPWVYGTYVKGFGYDMDNCPFVANIWLDK
jgi:peptide/nickel transport system substrate-binding protein